MEAKYKVGQIVTTNNKGIQTWRFTTRNGDICSDILLNKPIAQVEWSDAHQSFMYRLFADGNWFTESSIDKPYPPYVKLVEGWSVGGEYKGEIFELSTLDNLSKFRDAPTKKGFREFINSWIEIDMFIEVEKKEFLLQEAKRNYPPFTLYRNVSNNNEFTVPTNPVYSPVSDKCIGIPNCGYLYSNGVWANKIGGVSQLTLQGGGVISQMSSQQVIYNCAMNEVLNKLPEISPNHLDNTVKNIKPV